MDTSFLPLDKISLVLKPSSRTFWTAMSKLFASFSRSKEYLRANPDLAEELELKLRKPLEQEPEALVTETPKQDTDTN